MADRQPTGDVWGRKVGNPSTARGNYGYTLPPRIEDDLLSGAAIKTRYFGLMGDRKELIESFLSASRRYQSTNDDIDKQEMDRRGKILDDLQERIDKLCERGGFRDDDRE
jgi:hypothetical protein